MLASSSLLSYPTTWHSRSVQSTRNGPYFAAAPPTCSSKVPPNHQRRSRDRATQNAGSTARIRAARHGFGHPSETTTESTSESTHHSFALAFLPCKQLEGRGLSPMTSWCWHQVPVG